MDFTKPPIEANPADTADIQKQVEQHSINLVGGSTMEDQRNLESSADATSMWDLTKQGFTAFNAAVGFDGLLDRKSIAPDANFSLENSWGELTQDIPGEYHDQFLSVGSKEEGLLMKSQIQQELQSKALLGAAGYRGMTATVLASTLDVDAVLMLASGGSILGPKVASTLGKVGVRSSVVLGGAETAVAGAEAAALTETVNTISRPTADAHDIVSATIGGLTFGAVLGGIGGTAAAKELSAGESGAMMIPINPWADAANEAIHKVNKEIHDSKTDGSAGNIDYTAAYGNPKDFELSDTLDMVGTDKTLLDASQKYIAAKNLNNPAPGGNSGLSKAAMKFEEYINKTPLQEDFSRLWGSNSDIFKVMSHKMLESPSGVARNNRSASNMMEVYHTTVATPFMSQLDPTMSHWMNSKGFNAVTASLPSTQAAFAREFMLTHNHKYITGEFPQNTHPSIAHLSTAMDASNYKALEISKGQAGEIPVRGVEDIQAEAGWMRQIWDSQAVVRAVQALDKIHGVSKGKKVLADTLSNQYQLLHGWTPEESNLWANAVVRRAIANERGADTNVYRMINEEGVDYAVEFLHDSGISRTDAETMINSLLNRTKDQKNPNYTKKRGDVNLSTQIPGTTLQLVDLMNPDIISTFMRYSKQVAGHSALARHGIQYADRKAYIRAGNNELVGKGFEPLNPEIMDGVFDAFNGGTILGGINPWVRRVNQLTRLGLLNASSITQVAEAGVTVAAVGISNFTAVAGGVVKDIMHGRHVQGLEGLGDMFGPVLGSHVVNRHHISLEEGMRTTSYAAKLGEFLDKTMSVGLKLQPIINGFHKVHQFEQATAAQGMMNKLFHHFNSGKTISDARLYDIGLGEAEVYNRVAKYFTGENPAVFKNANGEVVYDWARWNPADKEDFVLALNRHTNQCVQKSMAGEETYWFNKTEGAALTALKRFTLLSLKKQIVRNMRYADLETLAQVTYGTMTAGLAYATRETLAGRGDELDSGKIARGAIGYGNVTGALAFGYDPLMGLLGQDDMKISPYDRGGLFAMPVQLETVNRLVKTPVSAAKLITGNASNSDVYNMQALPLVGNFPVIAGVWNSMKDHIKEEKAAERKAAKAQKQQDSNPKPVPAAPPVEPPAQPTQTSTITDKLGLN